MELLEFGHGGTPFLVFPTSLRRFHEFEDHGMVAALRAPLDEGRLRLFCVDSVDAQSWYRRDLPPWERIAHHARYEAYVLDEVLPLMRAVGGADRVGVAGCSFGGFHAVNVALRHPERFCDCLSLGGAFDLRAFVGDYDGADFAAHQPLRYLRHHDDGGRAERCRSVRWVLATGERDICRDDNLALAEALRARDIPHVLDVWGDETGHDWPWWRRMAAKFLAGE